MIDEIFDRGYQAARGDLNAGAADLFAGIGQTIGRTIGDSMKVLHRIEWSAPWAPSKKRVRRA